MITLGILFIAVLLAYRQRDTALQAAKKAAEATAGSFDSPKSSSSNPYYPGGSHAPTQGAPNPPKRELPQVIFRLFSKIPSPFPYIWSSIKYLFHLVISLAYLLSPLVVQPLLGLWHILQVIFSPLITLIQALNYYLILIPMGVALAIGRTLYPLYVLGIAAILFGGIVGAFGGWIHWGLVSPVTVKKSHDVQGDVHREIRRLVDGKSGLKRDEKKKGRVTRTGNEEYEMASHMGAGMSRVKEEQLRGWRESVW
jgi:hypothetical protein